MSDDDDPRLFGQEDTLADALLRLQDYRAFSEAWKHDHCSFCFAKFMDATYSEEHRRFIAENPEVLTRGYATTAAHKSGGNTEWICPTCFADFRERFGWRVVEGPVDG